MQLASIPTGSATNGTSSKVNPFRALLKTTNMAINPQFPAWALAILIFFAILRGILILICVAIMVIPLGRGPASRKKHLFLFRRVYAEQGRGIPYVVPNRSMIIAVCELFSSVFYLFAACENYRTYHHSGLRKGDIGWYLTLWYGLAWLPSYLGIMMSAFSLGYACLCDVTGVKNSRFPQLLTPAVYNTAWVSWLMITIASMAYWAVRMSGELFQSQIICLHVVSVLEKAIISWDTHGTTDTILMDVVRDQSLLVRRVQEIGKVIDGWAATWIILSVAITVFYLFTVQLLLRMLKQVLRKREVDSMAVNSKWSSPIWQELEDEFRFLCKSSILVTLSIVSQISELVYQTHSARNLAQLNWRIGSALITHLPGIFMTPALLVQSWRILTERSDESKYQRVPLSVDEKNIPKMTSQLLGWDTTVFWGKEKEFELGNFPGLCPVESIHSTTREDEESTKKIPTLHIPSGDISVKRSTVVTHEEI